MFNATNLEYVLRNLGVSHLVVYGIVTDQCARVSDPTVVRLAAKLGYDGFGDLQNSLIGAVDAHLNSLLTILARRGGELDGENLPGRFLSEMAGATRAAGDGIIAAEFVSAVDLLVDRHKRMMCLGVRQACSALA